MKSYEMFRGWIRLADAAAPRLGDAARGWATRYGNARASAEQFATRFVERFPPSAAAPPSAALCGSRCG